jgi:hypothetical protein
MIALPQVSEPAMRRCGRKKRYDPGTRRWDGTHLASFAATLASREPIRWRAAPARAPWSNRGNGRGRSASLQKLAGETPARTADPRSQRGDSDAAEIF